MIPETRRLRSRRNDSWPDCMFLSSFVEICLHLVGSPQHCTSTLPGFLAEAQLELEFCPSPTRQGISSVSPMIGPGGGAGGAEEGGRHTGRVEVLSAAPLQLSVMLLGTGEQCGDPKGDTLLQAGFH